MSLADALAGGCLAGAAVLGRLGPAGRLLWLGIAMGRAPAGPSAPPPWLALAAGGLAGAALDGPVLAAVLGVAGGWASSRRAARQAERRRAALRRLDVELAGRLAGAIRAGGQPPAELRRAAADAPAELAPALRGCAAALESGADVRRPLGRLPPGSTLRKLGPLLTLAGGAGAPLAAAVDRLGRAGRLELARADELRSALAGPAATARLLAALPLAALGLAAALGGRPDRLLLHTRFGAGCLAVGAALTAAGLWWTGRLVARAAAGCGLTPA